MTIVAGLLLCGAVVIIGLVIVVIYQTTRASGDLNDIHVLVNSRLTEVRDRVEQLTAVLEQAGIDVPDPPGGRPIP